MPVTGPKPDKPTPDFPLFPHASGQWAKKIRGKLWYFGSWSDPTAALNRYLDEKFEHEQGRVPKSREGGHANGCSGCSLKQLANTFMISQDRRLKAGELSERTFADYFKACKRILEFFGKETAVSTLRGADFRAFRESWPETWGLQMHSDLIARTKTVFGYAVKNGLIDSPVNFGSDFDKPSKQQMRRKRQKETAERGTLEFTSEQIQSILTESSTVLKACVLLGINCGFGNSDCASLTERVIDLESGWIDFPRPKTGIHRRCKLWPETVDAIKSAITTRPAPFDPSHAGLCFLTSQGRPLVWHSLKDRKHSQTNNVTTAFGKVLKKLKIQKAGLGFYSLRRTFETIGGATKDQVAVDVIMGHSDESMAGVYRQGLDDSRLIAVSDFVRSWTYPPKPESFESPEEASNSTSLPLKDVGNTEMFDMYKLDDYETRIHEAGHAVIAKLCRSDIESVSVIENADSHGRFKWEQFWRLGEAIYWDGTKFTECEEVDFSTYKRKYPVRARKELHATICIILAGHKATEMVRKTKYDFHRPYDQNNEDDEISEALAYAKLLDGKLDEYTRLVDATETLLRENWRFVDKLATQLATTRCIEAPNVYDFLPPWEDCHGIEID